MNIEMNIEGISPLPVEEKTPLGDDYAPFEIRGPGALTGGAPPDTTIRRFHELMQIDPAKHPISLICGLRVRLPSIIPDESDLSMVEGLEEVSFVPGSRDHPGRFCLRRDGSGKILAPMGHARRVRVWDKGGTNKYFKCA